MEYFLIALCAVAGYLIGSLSFSVIISKLAYKGDVRNSGSGNAGATNMARVYGLKGGLIVLLGDFLKCVIAMLAAYFIGLTQGDFYADLCKSVAGGACMIGHAFPLYFKFKGGKGISVGAGMALMSSPIPFILLIILSVFIIVFAICRIVSAASISAAVAYIITAVIFYIVGLTSLAGLLLGTIAPAFVIWLHRKNIGRLVRGEEKKFTFKKKDKVNEDETPNGRSDG